MTELDYNAVGALTDVRRFEWDDTDELYNLIAQSQYQYNARNQITSINHQDSNNNNIVSHGYLYNADGNITQYTNSLDGSVLYDYDFLGQLTGADYSNLDITDESYQYDLNGNRELVTNANGDLVVYTTGTNNELTSDGAFTYAYDAEGNRISKTNAAGTERELYEWDYRNRLSSVTKQEYNATTQTWETVQIVEYAYDYNNVLIRKVLDANGDGTADSKTLFLPENYQTAIQLDDADLSDLTDATVSHRYLWTPGQQDKLLADVTPTETLWTLTDHLGTIRDIVKNTPSGLVVPAHIIYDAYGNVLSCKDPNGTDIESPILFGFTGKYFDADTQLQNNVNRWYDATTGRWLSTDPIGFEGNDTNLYRYAGNKIPQMLDTWGLFNIETLLCTIKKERPALYENVRSNKVKIYTVDNFLRKYLIKSDKTQKIEIRDSSETKALFDSTKNSIYIRKEKNGAILTDCEVIKYLTHEIIHAYDFHQRKDIWKDKSVREIRAYVGSYVLYHYLQTGQLLTKKDKEIQDYLMQIKNMLNSREAYSAKELNDGFVQEYAGEVIINETVIWDWTKEPDCNSNKPLEPKCCN